MASSTPKSPLRVRLIVGEPEPGELLVAGAFDNGLWEILDWEETDRLTAEMQRAWSPDCVTWREVVIDLPFEDVIAAFRSPKVRANVIGAEVDFRHR